jgi:hypothetical protein
MAEPANDQSWAIDMMKLEVLPLPGGPKMAT